MSNSLDAAYWTKRYLEKNTCWDVGAVTLPIKQYLDQILPNPTLRILIPGAGNAYEAKYAFESGFKQVCVLDFSPVPLQKFLHNCPDFPSNRVLVEDFFQHQGEYDLILEQTFFCAIEPNLRPKYAEKMYELLAPEGKLVGVMFSRNFDRQGPPFGGTKEEYLHYFKPFFGEIYMESCYNSIPPRMGSELFISMKKSR